MSITSNKTVYKDRFLWIFFYPLASLSFIFIANDNSFLTLIFLPTFFTDVIFALIVTYFVGLLLKKMTLYLDFNFSWNDNFKKRVKLQILYGILFPLFISMFLEILYLYFIQIPLSSSSIFYLEFPLAFLLLLLANSFYVANYFFIDKNKIINSRDNQHYIENDILAYIIVQKGFKEIKIDLVDCAFIKSAEKMLWLYAYNGEIYRLNGTLEEWEKKLKENFFRINRQYLANAKAVESVVSTATRKLQINFIFPQNEEIYVSKANASEFRKWWKRQQSV
ncbi:LytTr DNA-binding domain-containing protein [Flavobacterium sp. 9AF]|uniref:LytR/AlgR family response regulator transcription factor n=1 Tax=Flavobacterium sp. 9AF TaxID=2653142 RepID=UPI0012F2D961|nr:LytTR family DNA-binding domain-containing protein [Flavobacterium sp. 9AF]VXA94853.1 LytTr DNA-binding domain-containing protein [Flavobacterium sp. 9AF]